VTGVGQGSPDDENREFRNRLDGRVDHHVVQAGGVHGDVVVHRLGRAYGRRWLKWVVTSGLGLALTAGALVWDLVRDQPAGTGTVTFNACATAPKKVAIEVNKPITVDLLVMPTVTPDCTDISGKPDARPVLASRTLSAKLASAAFPGQVTLIGQEKLFFEPSSGLPLEWSWEVLGTRPGKYVLSLLITAIADDGTTVRYQNPRSTVEVTVTGDLGDTITLGAIKADNFLKIIASAVGSLGLIIATIGGWRWHRKRAASRRTDRGTTRMVSTLRKPKKKRSLLRR
jgi:hypothetical protein